MLLIAVVSSWIDSVSCVSLDSMRTSKYAVTAMGNPKLPSKLMKSSINSPPAHLNTEL